MEKKLLGIDLGGTTSKMAIVSKDGSILDKWHIKTDQSDNGNHIVPNIINSIKSELPKAGYSIKDIVGIGMGTPGTIDQKKGTVYGAYNLNWAQPHKTTEPIEQAFHLPFAMDNDANVATLGEYLQGAGGKYNDIVLVTLGTGVGGGVIANGKLLHGCNGDAGEIGHITVQPNGYMCKCGKRGCLEQYASATGVVHIAHDLANERIANTENSRLKKIEHDHTTPVTSKMIFYLADQGDVLANQVVNRVCKYLGLALANVADVLNPDAIIIGGGVSNAGDTLLQPTTKEFQKDAFKPVRDSTKLQLATLGNDAGVIGAAGLAIKFDK